MAITKSKAATEAHIDFVLNDPEFIEEHKELRVHSSDRNQIEKLLNRYGLDLDDFDVQDNPFAYLMNPDTHFSAGHLAYDSERQEFTARFGGAINETQFQDLWKLIQRSKRKNGLKQSKKKPPLLASLLYAMFKAKKNGREPQEIFADYQDGVLPLYVGKKPTFTTVDDLEHYYRKHYSRTLK